VNVKRAFLGRRPVSDTEFGVRHRTHHRPGADAGEERA